jgi:peptidoglycan/xylan/chitin deacetylase (PgdA/CDA1 family)
VLSHTLENAVPGSVGWPLRPASKLWTVADEPAIDTPIERGTNARWEASRSGRPTRIQVAQLPHHRRPNHQWQLQTTRKCGRLMTAMVWPQGKHVAVMITAALELWSPGTWPLYAPMAAPWPMPGLYDGHSVSWSEYGATTGVWRLLDILRAHDMLATFGVNALVAERFPGAVSALYTAGHEIAAHSYAQDVMPAALDAEAERMNIRRCTEILERIGGVRPVGWMSPRASASQRTAELLAEAGYLWSGDYNDHEMPQLLSTPSGPVVAIMHSEFSDVRFSGGPRAFLDVHTALLEHVLNAPNPGVLNITVHAHVGGRPLLSEMFDRVLDVIDKHRDAVWIATHQQVAQRIFEGRTV